MPAETTTIRQVREVLRLKFVAGVAAPSRYLPKANASPSTAGGGNGKRSTITRPAIAGAIP